VQYNNPCTRQDWLWGFQYVQSLILQANLHVNVASSSELNSSRFYSRRNFSSNHSFRVSADRRDIVRPEGLSQSKLPTAPSGIQTASFLLVVRWVNWLSYGVINCKLEKIFLVFVQQNIHYPVHSGLPLPSVLLSISTGHILLINFVKIHINIIVPSTNIYSKWFLHFMYSR
jgi:hypothetical protein